MKLAKEIALWAITLLLVYGFAKAGIMKFSAHSGWAHAFHTWGYPVWFRVAVGVAELLAALLLLYKRAAALGALVIVVVMLGAMATHVFIEHHPKNVTSEIFPLLFAIIILVFRWQEVLGFRRKTAVKTLAET